VAHARGKADQALPALRGRLTNRGILGLLVVILAGLAVLLPVKQQDLRTPEAARAEVAG
jgi:hypothetical protein